jgi:hypothetical protein
MQESARDCGGEVLGAVSGFGTRNGASMDRSPAMQTIYVSNKGDDKNKGLTSETPVLSWKRLQVLCKGNQAMFLMEGKATLTRLRYKLDEGVLHYGISVHTKPRKATERR